MSEADVKVNLESSEKKFSLITAILFWCGLVVVSSIYITIPLISVFAGAFDVSTSQATWASSAFSFCYALGFLFFGPLSDRYGRKQIIIFGLIALTMVTPLVGLATNLSWLIALRAIQGVVAATFAPAAISYVVEMFPAEKRITTTAFISTSFLMSGIVGQVLSSLVSEYWGWSYVFYLLGALYLISTILVMIYVPVGNVISTNGSVLDSFKQFGKVLTQKNLLLSYIIAITLFFAFVGMYTTLGSYLSESFGLDSQSILYVRCVGILGMIVSPYSGKLVAKFSLNVIIRVGLILAVSGLASMGVSSNLVFLVVMSVVFVAGISITVSNIISLIGQLGGAARGAAISMSSFILFLGATLGPIAATGILNRSSSYLVTFEMLALVLGIGLIASTLIKGQE